MFGFNGSVTFNPEHEKRVFKHNAKITVKIKLNKLHSFTILRKRKKKIHWLKGKVAKLKNSSAKTDNFSSFYNYIFILFLPKNNKLKWDFSCDDEVMKI